MYDLTLQIAKTKLSHENINSHNIIKTLLKCYPTNIADAISHHSFMLTCKAKPYTPDMGQVDILVRNIFNYNIKTGVKQEDLAMVELHEAVSKLPGVKKGKFQISMEPLMVNTVAYEINHEYRPMYVSVVEPKAGIDNIIPFVFRRAHQLEPSKIWTALEIHSVFGKCDVSIQRLIHSLIYDALPSDYTVHIGIWLYVINAIKTACDDIDKLYQEGRPVARALG